MILRTINAAFLATALLLFSACESTAGGSSRRLPTDAELEAYNATVPPEERIICREETPTGSKIPRRVCRRVGDIAATIELSQDLLRRMLER